MSDRGKINKYRVFDFFLCLIIFHSIGSDFQAGDYFSVITSLWLGGMFFFDGSQALIADNLLGVKITKTLKIVFLSSVVCIVGVFIVLYFTPEVVEPYSVPLIFFAALMAIGLVGLLIALLLWYRSYRYSDEYKQNA